MKKLTVGIDLAPLTRRQLLRSAALTAGAVMLPWDVARAETKLQVGTIKIGDLSPFFIAQEKGFFKDAGLDVNAGAMGGGAAVAGGGARLGVGAVAMVGGAAIQPALASGALNIGWTNVVSMFQGHQEGFDYRFITSGGAAKRGTRSE